MAHEAENVGVQFLVRPIQSGDPMMKLNLRLSQWASAAEVISAIALVISLLYVAFQIKQNTAAVQSSTFKEVTAEWGGLQLAIIENSDFAEILVKAEAQESLTPVEAYRVNTYIFYMLANWEQAYMGQKHGLLADGLWQGYDDYYKFFANQAYVRTAWEADPIEGGYDPEFIQYVNGILHSSHK